jgi:hypothetical protein
MIDLETLDVRSSAVVLSIAVIEFDLAEVPEWTALVARAFFVKFDVNQQVTDYKSSIDKSTLEWWSKQSKMVKERSFIPGKFDVSAADGLALLRDHCDLNIKSDKNRNSTFWARGCLDQVCLDDLSRNVTGDLVVPYNNWYDVRTAIDLTCENSHRGYCKVPGFDYGAVCNKHDPIHDCANDLMMLLSNNIPKAA